MNREDCAHYEGETTEAVDTDHGRYDRPLVVCGHYGRVPRVYCIAYCTHYKRKEEGGGK